MTHTEQVEVYKYTKVPTGSGGFSPATPERQQLAPTWATIQPASGYDIQVSGRNATETIFKIVANYRPGFTWQRDFFITSRFGNIDVFNIFEDTRKRTVKLMGVRVEGVNPDTGTGTGVGSGIKVLYHRTTYGATSVTIPALVGAGVLLAFRDGIGKEVVAIEPNRPEQMQFNANGTFTLSLGDIFGDELLTVLYRN